MKSAEGLKELRSRLGITTREVAEQSYEVAETAGNREFYISNAWLTKLENTGSVPSIHKLLSLSVIYRIKFSELLLLFGIDLEQIQKLRLEITPQQTHLMSLEVNDREKRITFPVKFTEERRLHGTNLLSRLVDQWGDIPFEVLQRLDLPHNQYGFIGIQDLTLYPLLRPGSFVQIDPRVRKVQPFRWRTEFDRPIYFLELREGYACGWCEAQEKEIVVVPHPLSPCTVRRFAYPGEAEIVGQVTGIAMRLISPQTDTNDAAAQSNKRI